MGVKHLRRKPNHPKNDPNWWWYEDEKGWTILYGGIKGENAVSVSIPWKTIQASVARKGA